MSTAGAKRAGKLWLKFKLFGLEWNVRIAPARCAALDRGRTAGICYYEDRLILISDALSTEQKRTTLAHEIQHMIEDHADVSYEHAAPPEVADRCTDQVARGWLYLIRDCPEIVAIFQARD